MPDECIRSNFILMNSYTSELYTTRIRKVDQKNTLPLREKAGYF